MKRFKTIHKIPPQFNSVLQSSAPFNVTVLEALVLRFDAELKRECSNVPILQYSLHWTSMTTDTLAYTYTYYSQSGDIWIPANHFVIHVNPHVNWWIGECSNIPHGHYDLKSTLMHEVLHGLGYLSTIDKDGQSFPTNFDLLLKRNNQQPAVVGNTYQGSYGEDIYIDDIPIYNPNPYESGSSFSHTDDGFKLMSQAMSPGFCHRQLDYNTKRILNHLGYNCKVNTIPSIATIAIETGNNLVVILIIIGIVVVIAAGIIIGVVVKNKAVENELTTPLIPNKKSKKKSKLKF